ncbi:MerR family transcriptional regulator [Streptomyces sp. SP18CS02]|uniref:MerR family transcriptional regulator n=1 Tax=Streptomyces sp. SP18CS02 TaxID=3002531 RepID=UPI002E7A7A7A|nr:MerR family transcriptional regulator [Streptomyces sp. SP18CS02]MEE1753427.1 MerR family transcriptional regulator [Streptomyces sp. SP18CS02]
MVSGTVALTTGALALRLGVAPTTLRTWERRYGIGPGHREPGRHRRWTPQDVALLEHMCRLTADGVPPADAARAARDTVIASTVAARTPPPPPETYRPAAPAAAPARDVAPTPPAARVPDGDDTRRTVRGLGRAAERLDAPRVERLLARALAVHGPATAWDSVMTPTLRAIGRRWAASGDTAAERYVEAEHLLSWHVSTALRRACATTADGEGRPVLLACAPGEMHTLALEALAAALAGRGVPVRMFGAAVPPGALTEAVRRSGPRAVVLWSQSRHTADRAVAGLVRTVTWGVRGARVSPALLTAGPGWARGPRVPGARRPAGLCEALALLDVLPGRPG